MDMKEKIKSNTWDNIDDFIRVLQDARTGKWSWLRNNRCKYVELRIDMRGGACIIRDRHGNRIDPNELAYQYEAVTDAAADGYRPTCELRLYVLGENPLVTQLQQLWVSNWMNEDDQWRAIHLFRDEHTAPANAGNNRHEP